MFFAGTEYGVIPASTDASKRARSTSAPSPKGGKVTRPQALGELTIRLDNKQLRHCPQEVCQKARCERLSLSRNLLSGLPSAFNGLHNLAGLNLNYNKLGSACLTNLLCLTNLRELRLRGNQLEDVLPQLARLTKLKLVDLSENPLSEECPRSAQTYWSIWYGTQELPENAGAITRALPSTWKGSPAELGPAWRRVHTALLGELPGDEAQMIEGQLQEARHEALVQKMLQVSKIADVELLQECHAAAVQAAIPARQQRKMQKALGLALDLESATAKEDLQELRAAVRAWEVHVGLPEGFARRLGVGPTLKEALAVTLLLMKRSLSQRIELQESQSKEERDEMMRALEQEVGQSIGTPPTAATGSEAPTYDTQFAARLVLLKRQKMLKDRGAPTFDQWVHKKHAAGFTPLWTPERKVPAKKALPAYLQPQLEKEWPSPLVYTHPRDAFNPKNLHRKEVQERYMRASKQWCQRQARRVEAAGGRDAYRMQRFGGLTMEVPFKSEQCAVQESDIPEGLASPLSEPAV